MMPVRTMREMLAVLLAAALVAGPVLAQRGPERERGHEHFDVRHGHNHSYLDRGVFVPAVPHDARLVAFGRDRYWFHDGVWYRPSGAGFIVAAPPFGIVVPVLPAFFTALTIGAIAYYYANDTYYVASPQGGYQVVAPPPGVDAAAMAGAPPPGPMSPPPGAPPADNIFIYPKNGQSPDQQGRDRYECHLWAASQTGFDPSAGGRGLPPGVAEQKRSDYGRAMNACLEARGYTVR